MLPHTLGIAVLYSAVFSLSARIIVCTGIHRIVTTLLFGVSPHDGIPRAEHVTLSPPTTQVYLQSVLISYYKQFKMYGIWVVRRGIICTPRVLKYSRPGQRLKKFAFGVGGLQHISFKSQHLFSPYKEIK